MAEPLTPENAASSPFPVGMEILHDDPDAVADVCFVHGATEGRRSAWTADQQSEPWLKTLLPSYLNNVRILSFGYDPSHGYFRESHMHALDLLADIVYHRRQAPLRPLIFITHCIGGLVCQEAINISHASHEKSIANVFFALRGIIFINTPYLDEYRKAHWEPQRATRSVQTEHSRGDKLNYDLLRANFFRAMRYRPKIGTPVNVTFLFAMLDYKGIAPAAHKVFNVAYDVLFEFVPLSSKHIDIVKIGSTKDQSFEPIVGRLNKWTTKSDSLKQDLTFELDRTTTASFQTGRSMGYAQNSNLHRYRHRDYTTRQPEPQPSLGPQWDYEIFEPSLFPESANPPASFFIPRPCYVLCFLMFLIIGGSASLGIYYSVRYDKMGDGFTAAGWIVAIGALILAGPLARHYPHCSCWATDKPLYSFELGRIEPLPASRHRLAVVSRE